MKAVKRIAGLAIIVGLLAITWIIDNPGVPERGGAGQRTTEGILYGLIYVFVIFLVFVPIAWLAHRRRKKAVTTDQT